MKEKFISLLMALTLFSFFASGQPSILSGIEKNTAIKLYEDSIPGSKTAASYLQKTDANSFMRRIKDPVLYPFWPQKEKANGTAVIICPGGSYQGLAIDHEGFAVARKFSELGITAFVLAYRLPSDSIMTDKSIGPLQDAQRAVQLLRERGAEWNIDSAKIGIMGFSAGGHLASTLGTHFEKVVIPNPHHISLRPNFMMLLYPVMIRPYLYKIACSFIKSYYQTN